VKQHASNRPSEKGYRPEEKAIHENMPRMRSQKRANSHKMQKMPQQEPKMEEERAGTLVAFL